MQAEQLGTGHAVRVAEPILYRRIDHVIVLYGDMPFLKSSSLQRLAAEHTERGNTLTLMTVTVPNFIGEFAPFQSFGRIIRNSAGAITRSVERKDCAPEEALGRDESFAFTASEPTGCGHTLKN